MAKRNPVWVIEASATENSNEFEQPTKMPLMVGFFGCLILLIVVMLSMIVTCWPQHNIILYPEYFYEPVGPVIFGLILITSTTKMIECQHLLNVDKALSWLLAQALKSFLILLSGGMITCMGVYMVWVNHLGYNFPMPFVGHLVYLLQLCIFSLAVWFLFPPRMKSDDKSFGKRLLVCIALIPLQAIMGLGYSIIPSLLGIIPLNMQWGIGIFLPLFKLFNMWWCTKIGTYATGGDKESAMLMMTINVGCTHMSSLVILLGSTKLAIETAYIIMLVDSLINAWSCITIIKMQRNQVTVLGPLG